MSRRGNGFTQVFGDQAPLRVLLESGPESEWVAQTLEACGHEVIVADPNYALMYGQRARRIKTDRRDVAALAEACRVGIYRAAHRLRLVRGMRLVRPRREGRQVFYALDDDHIIELLRQALTHVEDTWERFGDAGAATAFLGLVPREDSSGTRHRKGAITKAGPGPVRALLVQAAWAARRQGTSTIFPITSPASSSRCASLASAKGNVVVDDRRDLPGREQRPDLRFELPRDRALFLDAARPQRRAGDREPLLHDGPEVDLGA